MQTHTVESNNHVVAQAVLGVRTRLQSLWPVTVHDALALVIGVTGLLSKSSEVVELACERRFSPIVIRNHTAVSINAAELTVVLVAMSRRGIVLENALATSEWFVDHKLSVERAMSCTLAESASAALWAKQSVQLATILAFSCIPEVMPTLDAIFGAVVRSDARRVEDLHFGILSRKHDPNAVLAALEAVARSVL